MSSKSRSSGAIATGLRQRLSGNTVEWFVGVAVVLLLPAIIPTARAMSLATSALVFACIAAGLALVYSEIGLLPMSHAALWGVGSYTSFLAITKLQMTFWTSLPIAVAIAVLAGVVSALPAFRLRGHYFLITTFIVTQLAVSLEKHWKTFTGGVNGITVAQFPPPIWGVDFGDVVNFYYLAATLLIGLLVLQEVIRRSALGRRFNAIRENAQLAQAMGINAQATIVLGFALSGIFAGIGGALYGAEFKQIEPDIFGLSAAVLLPLVMMLGGARRTWGPVVGAFVVLFLPELLNLSPTQEQAVNGLLLAFIILVFPAGILGSIARIRSRVTRWMRPSKTPIGDLASDPPIPSVDERSQ